MVTVVDAFRFFSEFDTAEFLQDRFGKEEVPKEDQRTISDLFADQIEFANVIIINKTDIVNQATLGRVIAYVKALNPTAKLIKTKFSKADVREMLNTGKFDMAEAIASPGWLKSLHEMTVMDYQGKKRVAPKPETLEYGIGSFIYRARRPFDPLKLYRALEGKFILSQDVFEEEDDEGEGNEDEEISNSGSDTPINSEGASEASQEEPLQYDPQQILANKKASSHFSGLYRSKGLLWLATRPHQMGSWSTAGAMLTLGSDMAWFCTMPEAEWFADYDTTKSIKADFQGKWGDRRQEIVLIGERLDEDALTQLLDSCLLNEAEMCKWEQIMQDEGMCNEEKEDALQDIWDDGLWAEWVTEENDGEHDHHQHRHHHSHGPEHAH